LRRRASSIECTVTAILTGISTTAELLTYIVNGSGANNGFLIQPSYQTAAQSGSTAALFTLSGLNGGTYNAPVTVRADTNGQVRWSASSTAITGYINTVGWIDRRGRDN